MVKEGTLKKCMVAGQGKAPTRPPESSSRSQQSQVQTTAPAQPSSNSGE